MYLIEVVENCRSPTLPTFGKIETCGWTTICKLPESKFKIVERRSDYEIKNEIWN